MVFQNYLYRLSIALLFILTPVFYSQTQFCLARDSVSAFEVTTYPVLRNNGIGCVSCHDGSIAFMPPIPLMSHPNVETAHTEVLDNNLVDFSNPGNSRLVQRFTSDLHFCIPNCQEDGDTMLSSINDWIALLLNAQSFNLSPLSATNDLFTDHTVTASFLSNGFPEEGVEVSFKVTEGPNAGEMSDPGTGECAPDDCVTDANGQVSWTYSGDIKMPGTDIIIATAVNPVTEDDLDSNTVEKTWVTPIRPIPTISQWGLIITAVLFGIFGLMVIRRRQAAA